MIFMGSMEHQMNYLGICFIDSIVNTYAINNPQINGTSYEL